MQAWQQVCLHVLRPEHAFDIHRQLYADLYSSWCEAQLGPAPIWVPEERLVQQTNIAQFMRTFHVSFIIGDDGTSAESKSPVTPRPLSVLFHFLRRQH